MIDTVLSRIMQGVVYLGTALLSGIMGLIVVDVCMRYFFNSPIQGSYEIVEVLMGMLSPVVILYCAWHRGHVAVDIFFERFPRSMQVFCALLTSGICVLLCALLTWRSVYLIRDLYMDDFVTNLLFIPWWPVGVVVLICFVLLTLVEIRAFKTTLEQSRSGGEL